MKLSFDRDYGLLHFIVLIWGSTAIIGMLIHLPPVEMVFYRVLLSSIGLLFFVQLTRRSFWFHKRQDYWVALITGILLAAHWVLFFLAARVANISICLAGMATCALWTSLLEPLVYKRQVKWFEVVLSIIAFVGIAIIFNVEFDHFLGLFLAMLSALIAAVFTLINASFTKREDPFVITFHEMVGATLGTAAFFPIYLMLPDIDSLQLVPSWEDWGYLLVLSTVCTVYAYSYSVKLMQRLSAYAINLTFNLEPVYGIIMALVFFPDKEKMHPGFYVGGLLILTSVLLYPLLNRKYGQKALGSWPK